MESDYKRRGALQYLAAWDVRRGLPWGRCEAKNGIAAFTRLVDQVMAQEPYRSAPRVFWIVDNGSAHRGRKAAQRLRQRYSNLILVHTPVHASWLSQVEIFFSILQRKVLTPAAAPAWASWPLASSASKLSTASTLAPSAGASPALTSSAASRNSPHDPSRFNAGVHLDGALSDRIQA